MRLTDLMSTLTPDLPMFALCPSPVDHSLFVFDFDPHHEPRGPGDTLASFYLGRTPRDGCSWSDLAQENIGFGGGS